MTPFELCRDPLAVRRGGRRDTRQSPISLKLIRYIARKAVRQAVNPMTLVHARGLGPSKRLVYEGGKLFKLLGGDAGGKKRDTIGDADLRLSWHRGKTEPQRSPSFALRFSRHAARELSIALT
jgi:hypothetical protein